MLKSSPTRLKASMLLALAFVTSSLCVKSQNLTATEINALLTEKPVECFRKIGDQCQFMVVYAPTSQTSGKSLSLEIISDGKRADMLYRQSVSSYEIKSDRVCYKTPDPKLRKEGLSFTRSQKIGPHLSDTPLSPAQISVTSEIYPDYLRYANIGQEYCYTFMIKDESKSLFGGKIFLDGDTFVGPMNSTMVTVEQGLKFRLLKSRNFANLVYEMPLQELTAEARKTPPEFLKYPIFADFIKTRASYVHFNKEGTK